MDRIISFCLISSYLDPLPLSQADYIGLPRSPFTYLPITPISDPLLSYPVALCLSAYQWLFPYLPVRYIDSQSGGTVGLGLCPPRRVTLLARVPQQYIRMYS